ncbi:MAG: DNRLRE domain-containing protein [Woeseiaceae bacterium]|nr:DNRLRE domain-containing protein [Woeseiaceae bacterium]
MKMRLTLLLVSLAITIPVNAETITLTPSDDASVRDGITNVSEGASWLDVFDSSSIPRHTFIKFDLSDHSDDLIGDDISSATLRVYIQRVLRAGEVTFAIPNVDWDEGSLTGNDYPASFSNSSYATADIATSDKADYLEIDITDIAQDWFDGGDNYGVAILPTSGDNARIKFGSQRVSSKRPEVVIEATEAVAIGYENFSFGNALHAQSYSDDVFIAHKFSPLAKTTFSKGRIHPAYFGGAYTGQIGIAVYAADNYDGGPGTLLSQGVPSAGGFYGADTLEIDIEEVTLRPGTEYWFAIGLDMGNPPFNIGVTSDPDDSLVGFAEAAEYLSCHITGADMSALSSTGFFAEDAYFSYGLCDAEPAFSFQLLP